MGVMWRECFCLAFCSSPFPEIWTVRMFSPLAFSGWSININLNICLKSFIRRSPKFSSKNSFCTHFRVKHCKYLLQMNHWDFKLFANVSIFLKTSLPCQLLKNEELYLNSRGDEQSWELNLAQILGFFIILNKSCVQVLPQHLHEMC